MQSIASSTALPEGWVQYIDSKSKTYYVHLPTGDTQWTQPHLLPPMTNQSSVSYSDTIANDIANSRKSKMASYILVVGILVMVFLSGNYVGRHRSSPSPSVVLEEEQLPSSVTNIDIDINISSENKDDTNSSKPSTLSSRTRFWKYIQDTKVGLLGDNIDDDDGTIYDYYDVMELCLKNKQSESTLLNEETQAQQQPVIVDTVQDRNNRTVLVEIVNAITPNQSQSVKDLAFCTRKYFPSRFDERAFDGAGGGNDVTFINILLQLFLPDLAVSMDYVTKMAYDHAEWGSSSKQTSNLPEPSTCGLRTSEYLDYGKFKGLGGHSDAGSVYTVLFALSNPKMYKGGEYYIRPQDEEEQVYYYFKPRQYSVVVFLSDTYHGVTVLTLFKAYHEWALQMYNNILWIS